MFGVERVFLVPPRGEHHVKEYDDGHCSSVLSAVFSWINRLESEPSDLELLIEDSNRPAEEIRLATGFRVDVIEQMRGDVQKRLRDNPEF